jgi:hypothetical protein
MRGSLNWNDAVTAAAHAVLAERAATPARPVADASFRWNAYDVWLSRVQPPREQATPSPQGTTRRD